MKKPLQSGLENSFALALLLLCACRQLSDAPREAVKYPPVPEWGNLGAVDIVPGPKHIQIGATRLPLANLTIRYLPDADGQLKTGAGEIAARITGLGGAAPQIASSEAGVISKGLAGPTVVIGYGKGALPFKNIPSSYQGVSVWDEEQGYVIAVKKAGGADAVVVWGTDAAGAFYGCITLARLIGGNQAEGVYARQAEVIDWPDFKRRQTSGMELAGHYIRQKRFDEAVTIMKQAIRHAAGLKCNSVEVGFFGNEEVEYLSEDVAGVLKQVKDYARAYGVRFAFFFSTSIASKDRAEKDPRYKDIPCIRGKYMTWSNDELIDESLQRLKDQVAIFKGQADYGFHLPDINEGGWAARAESDRQRWGDDRAGGDAYFANKTYQAVKEADPGARVQFVFYNYSLNLGYAGNAKSKKYFADLSASLPADLLFSKREGSIESFQSWRKNIKQPLAIYWSPYTFWGARAFAPDMAFLKTTYHANRQDLVMDCMVVGTRPVLIPSQYAFAEYAWNVNAPGAGIWHQDPAVDQTNSATGVPGDYVGEGRLHESGIPFRRWADLEGQNQPAEMMHELLERICRMVYGEKAAPAMAEALRNSCTTSREYWSDDPEIARAQYAAAKKAFETLIPLWDKKEYFADQYGTYRQLTRAYADLHVLMKYNYAAAEINSLLGKARADETNRVQFAKAAAAACEKYMASLGPDKKYLKDLYDRYGFEGTPWMLLLQPPYGKYADIVALLAPYEQEFKQGLAEAEFLMAPPRPARYALVPYYDNVLAAGGRVPENLVRNSSFEELTAQGQPAEWVVREFQLARDDDAAAKRKAIKLTINPGQKYGEIRTGLFEVTPGAEYYIEFQLKKTAGMRLMPTIFFCSAGGANPRSTGSTTFPGWPENFNAVKDYKVFYGAVKTPAEKEFTRCYVRFMVDWHMLQPTAPGNLYLCGVKAYDLTAAARSNSAAAPVAFELVAPEKSDRTVQDGTDTFIKCKIRMKSPVPLTGLKVECIRVTAEGHRRNPVPLKGIPGVMAQDQTWESGDLEFNVGPAAPEARLIFKVTANECGFEVEKTLK